MQKWQDTDVTDGRTDRQLFSFIIIVDDTLEWVNLKQNCFISDDLSQIIA